MNYYEVALLKQSAPILTYSSSQDLEIGNLVEVPLKSTIKEAVVLKQTSKPEFATENILSQSNFYFKPWQIEIATFISNYYFSSIGEALGLFIPFNKEQIKEFEFTLEQELPKLTTLQQNALNEILNKHTSLLFGVTGSGKTEIYIHLIAQTLQNKKRAIILMPEIALTPQITDRIKKYFGDSVISWHSKLTKKQRQSALDKIYSGEIKVVIGARSALFLPLEDIGLIVVDEEHDDSYKAVSRPRYNAKDLSIYFGKKIDAKVVLGSATPLVSDYYKFSVVSLKKPYIEAKKEFKFVVGEELQIGVIKEIKNVLQKGEQALIFVPTRANFKYLICNDCGKSQTCPYCSIGMSLHRKKRALVCHYCNYAQAIPNSCFNCGSEHLITKRVGTAELKEMLLQELEDAKIEIFDKDNITTLNKLSKALDMVNSKESNVIIGTQMLSKGHDYPEITLSVITGLDFIVAMGDFRAKERAISLLHQIAGRSGRKKDATILIQSSNEQFYKPYISDYELFLKEELNFRKGLYPPFKNLSRVLIANKDFQKCEELTKKIVNILKPIKQIEIVGYGLSPIERIANRWRFNVLLRSDSKKELLKALHLIKDINGVEIDNDPVDFS